MVIKQRRRKFISKRHRKNGYIVMCDMVQPFCSAILFSLYVHRPAFGQSREMIVRLVVYVVGFYVVLIYGDPCGQSEYLSSAGECCPMCNIGLIVMRDCSGHSSTTCKPCAPGTYMNEPNGLQKCFPCTTCDNGLYVLRECTRIQNAVCDVQNGYYCAVYSGTECSLAEKHTECVPGQEIKTPGTKVSDTVCEDCPPGFYSPKGVNCTKLTDCSVKQEILVKEGSSIKDVECKPKEQRHRYFLIGPFLLAATAVSVCVFIMSCTSKGSGNSSTSSSELSKPVEESQPDQPSSVLSSVTL